MINYKIVSDSRSPVLLEHSKIEYSKTENEETINNVDTSYPGIVIDFGNNFYLLEDGRHRIAKLQQKGIYESEFYVVTPEEYKNGLVHMIYEDIHKNMRRCILGELCYTKEFWEKP